MTFADLLAGEAIFLDANTLVYHFGPHPVFGPACNQLLHPIENGTRSLSMAPVTLEEAQSKLPDIIQHLAAGDEDAITEGNQVVARIVGERRPLRQRPGPGLCKGMMTIVADDDEHLKDFAEYMP
jgi:antitoxin (DNA-binding transcriptional repressor) of toxin-antitoxin stability system